MVGLVLALQCGNYQTFVIVESRLKFFGAMFSKECVMTIPGNLNFKLVGCTIQGELIVCPAGRDLSSPRKRLLPFGEEQHRVHFNYLQRRACRRLNRHNGKRHRWIGANIELEFRDPGTERIDTRPLERVLRLHELRIDLKCPVEVESAYIEHRIDLSSGILRAIDLCCRVHRTDACFQLVQLFRHDEIDLVQQNHVSESNLLLHLVGGIDVLPYMSRINQRHDPIEPQLGLHLVIDKKGLRDRTGVGPAGSLDQNVIKLIPALHEIAEDADQVSTYGAADASVVHLEDLFFSADDEFLVHSDLAEFVLDHGDAFAMLFRENAIQQGC